MYITGTVLIVVVTGADRVHLRIQRYHSRSRPMGASAERSTKAPLRKIAGRLSGWAAFGIEPINARRTWLFARRWLNFSPFFRQQPSWEYAVWDVFAVSKTVKQRQRYALPCCTLGFHIGCYGMILLQAKLHCTCENCRDAAAAVAGERVFESQANNG